MTAATLPRRPRKGACVPLSHDTSCRDVCPARNPIFGPGVRAGSFAIELMYMRQLTLVLGVHRSGTSLLTAGLVAAGLHPGEFSDTRDSHNPEGYFEHPEVRDFNDRLLAEVGASWDNWGFHAPSAQLDGAAFAPWRAEAVALLHRLFEGPGPFVLKDPRIMTLWPFWQAVVPEAGFALSAVLILRDPLEVAESQRQRALRQPEAFPLLSQAEPMSALWTVTMQGFLQTLTIDSLPLITHADLRADPAGTLAWLLTKLKRPARTAKLKSFARLHFKPELYRAQAKGRPSGGWAREAAALYAALLKGGTPRLLSNAEAQTAATARRLTEMLRTLPAVNAMVQTMQADRQRERAAEGLAPLTQLAWGLEVPFLRAMPSANLEALRDKIAGTVDERMTNPSVFVVLARIEESLGHWTEAEAWLGRFAATHPFHPLPSQMIAELGQRKLASMTPPVKPTKVAKAKPARK